MADIKRIKWWPGVYSCANASVAADNLNQELSKVLDKWAPIRKVQIRQNYRPWISKETKDLINQRNLAQELASRSNKAEDWQKFKDLRNKVVTRTRNEKDKWEKNQLDNMTNTPTNLWRNIKSWMGWKSTGPPSQLFVDKIIVKPKDIANTMNGFFYRKNFQIEEMIP